MQFRDSFERNTVMLLIFYWMKNPDFLEKYSQLFLDQGPKKQPPTILESKNDLITGLNDEGPTPKKQGMQMKENIRDRIGIIAPKKLMEFGVGSGTLLKTQVDELKQRNEDLQKENDALKHTNESIRRELDYLNKEKDDVLNVETENHSKASKIYQSQIDSLLVTFHTYSGLVSDFK